MAVPSGPARAASDAAGPTLPAAPSGLVPLFPADDEATRKLIRNIARDPRSKLATAPAHNALAAAMQNAARPECLKSPAGGRGRLPLGGLLALPGLIYDAATGACAM
jgi:hypothetical protein